MKVINVTELKAHLSKYLRQASRGARIVVADRDEPVAQLGPLQGESGVWHERLAHAGRLRLGTQQWSRLRVSPTRKAVDIQRLLSDVREDPREVR